MDEMTRLALSAGTGDRVALAAFVRLSQPDVWRLCRHLVSADAADDVTQEVYLRALPALRSFRGASSARTWLLAIARNTAADAIRREQRRRRLVPRRPVPDHGPGSAHAVADLVARLDDDRREAFVLTQLLGLSYVEAAEACDVPVGTIRSRVARARIDLASAVRDAEQA